MTLFSQELAKVREQVDTKANITQEAWITPTLLNGGTLDANNPLQYMKDTLGFVHFRGKLTRGTAGQNAFTLPAGYRMKTTVSQLMVCVNSTSTLGIITFVLGGSQVYLDHPAVANSVFSLDGISYKAEE